MTMVEPPRFLDAWTAQQRDLAQPATPAVRRGPRPRYVQAALDGETEAVRTAPQGTRNHQLNVSALKLGRLVAAGLLEEETAVLALQEAAEVCGLWRDDGARAVLGTIRSGMRRGLQEPRDPGPPTGDGTGRHAADETRPLRELPGAAPRPPDAGPDSAPTVADYLQPAGTFLRALPDKPEPLWGAGDTVLWAHGEALMIAGSPGLGKTTLAGQLVRARLGYQPAVLDLPVREGGRLLYLMMDRPQQIARRLLQQFTDTEIAGLDERMTLGVGPPPQDMARNPDLLWQLCQQAGADTVVVDSLKDAAIGLVEDEVGASWNRARQLAITAGVQVLELHHLVKRGANGKDPDTLADVYGSQHLTAGVGSCLVLLGEPGSPVVTARHLKPVMEPFGPAQLSHDHARGVTTVVQRGDLLELLAVATVHTAKSAARALYETDKPSAGDVERVRRRLEALVAAGKAVRRDGPTGQTQYAPLTARTLTELRPQPLRSQYTPLELEDR